MHNHRDLRSAAESGLDAHQRVPGGSTQPELGCSHTAARVDCVPVGRKKNRQSSEEDTERNFVYRKVAEVFHASLKHRRGNNDIMSM